MTCIHSHLDGAYVLGALAPEERLEFERHLAGCPTCSRSVRDLAGLPGLLAQVSPEVLEAGPEEEPPPETLLPALVREVRRSRHRRRLVVGLAAAAAVAVLGIGSAAVLTHDGGGGGAPAAAPSLAPAALAVLTGRVILFASLGPTAVMQAHEPLHKSSRFYPVVVSHLVGFAVAAGTVMALGLAHTPSVFQAGSVSVTRAAATASRMCAGLALPIRGMMPDG